MSKSKPTRGLLKKSSSSKSLDRELNISKARILEFEGLTVEEIAERIDVSAQTARGYLLEIDKRSLQDLRSDPVRSVAEKNRCYRALRAKALRKLMEEENNGSVSTYRLILDIMREERELLGLDGLVSFEVNQKLKYNNQLNSSVIDMSDAELAEIIQSGED